MTENDDEPFMAGRGLVYVEQFAEITGLAEANVRDLIGSGVLAGIVDPSGRGIALFDDALPPGAELLTIGLEVSDAYGPQDLVGLAGEDDSEDGDDGGDGPGPDHWLRW